MSNSVRPAVAERRGDYVPVFLSEISRLFDRGYLPLDVAMVMVSPPDRHGFCSLGPSVDVARSAVRNAKTVIAQVNPKLPRTHGDGIFHIRDITALCLHEEDLRIGPYIVELIEDGATLQMGMESIPDHREALDKAIFERFG